MGSEVSVAVPELTELPTWISRSLAASHRTRLVAAVQPELLARCVVPQFIHAAFGLTAGPVGLVAPSAVLRSAGSILGAVDVSAEEPDLAFLPLESSLPESLRSFIRQPWRLLVIVVPSNQADNTPPFAEFLAAASAHAILVLIESEGSTVIPTFAAEYEVVRLAPFAPPPATVKRRIARFRATSEEQKIETELRNIVADCVEPRLGPTVQLRFLRAMWSSWYALSADIRRLTTTSAYAPLIRASAPLTARASSIAPEGLWIDAHVAIGRLEQLLDSIDDLPVDPKLARCTDLVREADRLGRRVLICTSFRTTANYISEALTSPAIEAGPSSPEIACDTELLAPQEAEIIVFYDIPSSDAEWQLRWSATKLPSIWADELVAIVPESISPKQERALALAGFQTKPDLTVAGGQLAT